MLCLVQEEMFLTFAVIFPGLSLNQWLAIENIVFLTRVLLGIAQRKDFVQGSRPGQAG